MDVPAAPTPPLPRPHAAPTSFAPRSRELIPPPVGVSPDTTQPHAALVNGDTPCRSVRIAVGHLCQGSPPHGWFYRFLGMQPKFSHNTSRCGARLSRICSVVFGLVAEPSVFPSPSVLPGKQVQPVAAALQRHPGGLRPASSEASSPPGGFGVGGGALLSAAATFAITAFA
ncbi:uncharacterized protein Tco025E_08131 [Trypanosoma conorhini]|uniref:Uncharacterized protein n=1 Tax=Trypanosoma conorhini TaxID=83891 RepID=A0A3R7KL84_9TRYP|nr:uncharacterized protein Tco025E_08131 [Trypanosoma conorhini]RNF03696.1 hypothetical protein Tco025E_08131 [Trypanosoma conorhini]